MTRTLNYCRGDSAVRTMSQAQGSWGNPDSVPDWLAPLSGGAILSHRRCRQILSSGTRLEPLAFIERLAALIPRSRFPLLTYHGVLAPAAKLRSAIRDRARGAKNSHSPDTE